MILLFNMRPRIVKNLSALFLFTVTITVSAAGQDSNTGSTALFIDSNPINALIIMDGEPLLQQTPALVRNLSPGEHIIGIRKDGYSPEDATVNLEAGMTEIIKAELSRGTILVNLPDENSVYLQSESIGNVPEVFRIPEGTYNFLKKEDGLYIKPVYPKTRLLTVTGTLFFAALAINTVSIAMELNSNGELFLPHSDRLIITEAAAAVSGLAELAMLIDKRSFISDFELHQADLKNLESEAEKIFQTSQRSLSSGKLEDALSGFSSLVSSYPDSPRFSESLYKIAKIHSISGDTNLAISELNIIIDRFPDAEIYDSACQTLALLYSNSGNPQAAEEIVGKMVFLNSIFSETEKEIEELGIEKVIENWARNPEGRTE